MKNETPEYEEARKGRADRWVPACGGHEKPTRYPDGRTYLYVFNFRDGQHAWLDTSTDIPRMDPPGSL